MFERRHVRRLAEIPMQIRGLSYSASPRRHFASDNNSPAHPAVLQAIRKANRGHAIAYGDDYYTDRAVKTFARVFGESCKPYFVFTGTGANVLSLAALARPYHAILCAETSHLNAAECGAPERFAGLKLFAVPTETGKIAPADIARRLEHRGDPHHSQLKVVSITQSTDFGYCYTADEVRALARCAHRHRLSLHMDGARIYNACAALGLSLKAMTADCGVDVLSLGGTKNGLLGAEAVVFFRPGLAEEFEPIRKQGTQLASKMRFLAVQLETLIGGDLWRRNASRANRMARRLADGLARVPGIRITREVQTNMVFCTIPRGAVDAIRKRYLFYVYDESRSEARLVANYDTTGADVDGFLEAARTAIRKR
jgi:threonine aldolase